MVVGSAEYVGLAERSKWCMRRRERCEGDGQHGEVCVVVCSKSGDRLRGQTGQSGATVCLYSNMYSSIAVRSARILHAHLYRASPGHLPFFVPCGPSRRLARLASAPLAVYSRTTPCPKQLPAQSPCSPTSTTTTLLHVSAMWQHATIAIASSEPSLHPL